MAFNDDPDPPHVQRLKRQKHLRAALRELRLSPGGEKDLCEATGLSGSDLVAVLTTAPGGVALEDHQLDALEVWVRRRRSEAAALPTMALEERLDESISAGAQRIVANGTVIKPAVAVAERAAGRVEQVAARLATPQPARGPHRSHACAGCSRLFFKRELTDGRCEKCAAVVARPLVPDRECAGGCGVLFFGGELMDGWCSGCAKARKIAEAERPMVHMGGKVTDAPALVVPADIQHRAFTEAELAGWMKEREDSNPIFGTPSPPAVALCEVAKLPPLSQDLLASVEPVRKMQTASILLRVGLEFSVTGPIAITLAEYQRICSWIRYQFIVES